ncbi:hypothetical protein IQ224_18255 [Microcystis sp. LEGE 00066]|uniref:hypothetical protein n=1 Tax=Microcystis sp. LEGE 00066 TaxID=1828685 RepID=UPI0019E5F025|nr:hypothetical protein [Microcystis sp. LEGE 00066]MBE9264011.1 hypothetical protein [Microcystis sp. LEGE 00066]
MVMWQTWVRHFQEDMAQVVFFALPGGKAAWPVSDAVPESDLVTLSNLEQACQEHSYFQTLA